MKVYVLTNCYNWEGDSGINTEAYKTRSEAEKKQRELLHQYVDEWLCEGEKVILGAEQISFRALESLPEGMIMVEDMGDSVLISKWHQSSEDLREIVVKEVDVNE